MDMTLIFSSFGFQGEAMRERFKAVLSREDVKGKTCWLIPFAGWDTAKTAQREKEGLIAFGFSPECVFAAGEEPLPPDPQFVYVCGGNTFRLAQRMHEHRLIETVKKAVADGAVYIGVSAGAYLAAPSVSYVRAAEECAVDGEEGGLGLISDGILCHAEHHSYAERKQCETDCGGTLHILRDEEIAVLKNGEWMYFGE